MGGDRHKDPGECSGDEELARPRSRRRGSYPFSAFLGQARGLAYGLNGKQVPEAWSLAGCWWACVLLCALQLKATSSKPTIQHEKNCLQPGTRARRPQPAAEAPWAAGPLCCDTLSFPRPQPPSTRPSSTACPPADARRAPSGAAPSLPTPPAGLPAADSGEARRGGSGDAAVVAAVAGLAVADPA